MADFDRPKDRILGGSIQPGEPILIGKNTDRKELTYHQETSSSV